MVSMSAHTSATMFIALSASAGVSVVPATNMARLLFVHFCASHASHARRGRVWEGERASASLAA